MAREMSARVQQDVDEEGCGAAWGAMMATLDPRERLALAGHVEFRVKCARADGARP
jgi:hypothetical protein